MDAFEFQKAQRARILSCYGETPESILEKSQENDLEKGGEGSKGGKIIGHTKSGKPIYDSFNHPAHKGFTKQEHREAAGAHFKLENHHDDKADDAHDAGNTAKAKKHEAKSEKHRAEGRGHLMAGKDSDAADEAAAIKATKEKEASFDKKKFEALAEKRRKNPESQEHHDKLNAHVAEHFGKEVGQNFAETHNPKENAHESLARVAPGYNSK
jgi:hypothetical protein